MNPDISIVVCTFNRSAMLRAALASLYDLATDGAFTYEIVVIDNASTDDTPQAIATAANESKQPLRGIHEAAKGIVPARNRGIREARGRWVAFFDDDQLADHQWLAELFQGAHEKDCRVVGGAVHLALPDGCERKLDPAVRMLLGESILSEEPLPYGGRNTPGCGNLMVERSVFDDVGVFGVSIAGRGEDTDLFVRIERAGIAAWYLPSAIIHHLTPKERLTEDYLTDLARKMGRGIGIRQAEQFGCAKFTALWLAKAARMAVVQWPLLLLDSLRGKPEAVLGRRCQLAISAGFLRGGCEATWRKSPAAAPAAQTVTRAPLLHQSVVK
jgi:glycosyltransferase involved in cell wall biosynthesis